MKIIRSILLVFIVILIYNFTFNNYNEIRNINKADTAMILNNMTLREKIGQMMIANTFGEDYQEGSKELNELRTLCEEHKVGGFIFFKGHSTGYAKLSNKLQSFSKTPLLISADFERGTRMRVTDGSLFPNNMAIGATNEPQLAYEMASIIAVECRNLGVHQNYAPVADVNNNQDNPIINVRSYGEDPVLVSKMSEMFIKGLQDNKVIATAKHFPGHGDTDIDSHNDLPVLNFDMERLYKIELVPFRNAIQNNVMSVMIAHLAFPALEPEKHLPASLSGNIVNDLLIEQMGFKGLVVTDALNMKGITKYYTTEQVALNCVNAGIDLILMPQDVKLSIDVIEMAVKEGRISEERINRSVEKILNAKKWLGLFEIRIVNEADVYKTINTDAAYQVGQKIADASITLVKDDNDIIRDKFSGTKYIVINSAEMKDNANFEYYNNKFLEKNTNVKIFDILEELDANAINAILESSASADKIFFNIYSKVKFGTGKIKMFTSHLELLKKLLPSKKVIVTSFGNPYLLQLFPQSNTYVCTYGDSDVSINSWFKAIKGEIKFNGKLPVSVSDNYKLGWSINK